MKNLEGKKEISINLKKQEYPKKIFSKKIDIIKNLFVIIILIFTINSYYNVYATNSTLNQTAIYLYYNSNCANYPITFRVLNETEYNLSNKKEISNYSSIGVTKYTIYDGPLSTLKILSENNTNSKSYFNFTFNTTNNYLIQLEPENKNFSKREVVLKVYDCGIKPGEIKTTDYNKTFLLNNFLVKIIKSNYDVPSAPVSIINNQIKNKENISLNTDNNISIKNYTLLYNFSISDKLTNLPGKIYIGVPNNNSEIIPTYAFVLKKRELFVIKDVKTFEFLNKEYFSFYYNGTGNYFIFGKKGNNSINSALLNNTNKTNNSSKTNSTNIETNINETKNITPNKSNINITNKTKESNKKTENKINKKSIDNNNQKNIDLTALKMQEDYQKKKRILLIVFLLVIVIIIASVLVIQSKKAKLKKNRLDKEILPNREDFNKNKNIDKNLSLVTKVRTYVRKYKKDYTKDQIYLALKKSNVPIDIIEKVFKEEF